MLARMLGTPCQIRQGMVGIATAQFVGDRLRLFGIPRLGVGDARDSQHSSGFCQLQALGRQLLCFLKVSYVRLL